MKKPKSSVFLRGMLWSFLAAAFYLAPVKVTSSFGGEAAARVACVKPPKFSGECLRCLASISSCGGEMTAQCMEEKRAVDEGRTRQKYCERASDSDETSSGERGDFREEDRGGSQASFGGDLFRQSGHEVTVTRRNYGRDYCFVATTRTGGVSISCLRK